MAAPIGRREVFVAVISLYALGLIFWLALGLLPTLADAFAPLHHWLQTVSVSSSPFAGAAARILDANQSMPGMALEASNGGTVAWAYAFSVINLVLGLVLAVRRSNELVPCLLAFALLGTAATFNKPSHAVFHIIGEPWPVKTVHFTFHIVSGVAYLWAVLLFPDGRLPRQIRLSGAPLAAVVAGVTLVIAVISWRSSFVNHPVFFVVFFGVVVSIAGIGAQALRIADPRSTATERKLARLLGAALLPAFLTGLIWLVARAGVALGVAGAAHLDASLQGVFPAVFAVVPVVLFAGILRYRLWNVDWLLTRGLLYGLLAAGVAAVYVATVALIGRVAPGNLWAVVAVLSVVAVGIDPVRRWLRGWCNRVIYGQTVSPADAVRAMLTSLEHVAPGDELGQLTRTVTLATRARRCELWLSSDEHLVRVAGYPVLADGHARRARVDDLGDDAAWNVPVVYQGGVLGILVIDLPPGTSLGSVEATLVRDLAAHAGVVVHNAALNTELARDVAVLGEQLEELRSSQRRLVAAQDGERRKLERDLHDGAQQSLVAVMIGLRTAAALRGRPEQQHSEVEELIRLLDDTGGTLSELVSDRGPRLLAERGVAGALTAAAALAERSGATVVVRGAVDRELPDDVAAAVYFCCLEAIQNATKHGRSGQIVVDVSEADGTVVFSVTDDGAGFDPSSTVAGSGLGNLSSRVSVLGGDVTVESAPGIGTTVRGWLPVATAAMGVAGVRP